MLELRDVKTFYGNIQALKGISLEVPERAIVAILGANGAGKSTTLRTIVSLGVVQVPEGRRIFPNMSVLENLEMGTFLRRDKEGIKKDIDYAFELFPILAQRRSQMGGTLSGGEQQMLAISRALMAKPRVLLLDEPSLGLAPLIIKQIFEIIKKINQEQKTTVFLVEQNANQALKLAHRGYVMENGMITLTDSSENLLNNEQVKAAYLGI